MLRGSKPWESGYSLLVVIVSVSLIGLATALVASSFFLLSNLYVKASEQTFLQQEARHAASFLTKELTFGVGVEVFSNRDDARSLSGESYLLYSDGGIVWLQKGKGSPQDVFADSDAEFDVRFRAMASDLEEGLTEFASLLVAEITVRSRKSGREASVTKTIKLLNSRLNRDQDGKAIAYVKPS